MGGKWNREDVYDTKEEGRSYKINGFSN